MVDGGFYVGQRSHIMWLKQFVMDLAIFVVTAHLKEFQHLGKISPVALFSVTTTNKQ